MKKIILKILWFTFLILAVIFSITKKPLFQLLGFAVLFLLIILNLMLDCIENKEGE